jgi:serine/threonine protein kinase
VLHIAQRLGDFEIIRLLGKGGMGQVYEAQQLHPPRRVALKVLAPWLAEDDEALVRFWREAAIPAQLDHPGIVRIIATGKTDEGIAYYAMQLVRGVSLSQLIRQAGAAPSPGQPTTSEAGADPTPSETGPVVFGLVLPTVEAPPPILERYRRDRYGVVLEVGIRAARALASAHRHGVLHRDVKPSNLMVDYHDQLYIVDFGLTRALTAADGTCSRPGAVCGTPWYMSPEQARGEPLDPRSDLYSLGVALYELATGGAGPYTASRQNPEAVLQEVRAGKVVPLRTLAPDIPPALERIIHRAMHFKPRRRHASGEELAAELEALAQPSAARVVRKSRRRLVRRLVLGVAAAVVLAGAVGATAWFARRPAQTSTAAVEGVPTEPAAPVVPLESLPPALLDRLVNHRVDLLRRNHDPLWGKKLFGKGRYSLVPLGLNLAALPGQGDTLIALDDPGHRGFELSIDVLVMGGKAGTMRSSGGVFFGWNRKTQAAGLSPSCFLLEIQEPAKGMAGPARLILEAGIFDEARGARQESIHRRGVLPPGKQIPPLPPAGRTGWRRVQVRAVDDLVTVSIDGKAVVEFDPRQCRRALGERGPRLDPHGALGVWVSQGAVFFRDGFDTTLPPEDNSP